MKLISTLIFLFLILNLKAQNSEDFIPKEAVSVFSINNVAILQKVSLDELVQYQFMEELQTELFDGSTSGKTLKDSGIDFNQKLNVFFGKNTKFEVSGFSFAISNKEQLFTVFDDFDSVRNEIPGTEFYTSLQNHLIIKGNIAVLMRVDPLKKMVRDYADSAWNARGFEKPNYLREYIYDENLYSQEDNEAVLEEVEFDADVMDSIVNIEEVPLDEAFPKATENPNEMNFSEFKDSVLVMFQKKFLYQICEELFIKKISLKSVETQFDEQLTHNAEAVFFLDNSKNLKSSQSFWNFQSMFPKLYNEIDELYSDNIIRGDLMLNENTIDFQLESNYGEALGSIYEKLNQSKFDKNILKYIHKSSPIHFTYNVNLREAYEQSFKIIVPILEKQKDPRVSSSLLALELLDNFINKDALFDTYKGTIFATFNGIQKVKTKQIEYEFDEETFEYEETEVEGEEDMPLFTFGISTNRPDIPEKILKHISSLTSRLKNKGDYWVYKNAIFESVPLYFINKNGLLIVTNDENLATKHSNGYGADAIKGKEAKKIKKGGFIYAYIDWAQTIDKLPREMFRPKQQEVVEAILNKTGVMEIKSGKMKRNSTTFDLIYTMNEKSVNSAKHVLDIINSVYVLSK